MVNTKPTYVGSFDKSYIGVSARAVLCAAYGQAAAV